MSASPAELEQAFRDSIAEWNASQLPPGAHPVEWVTPAELVEMYPEKPCPYANQCTPGYDCACEWEAKEEPRATPARTLRLRLYTDRLEGPGWLGLLCQCAWLRGGIVGET